MWRSGISSTDLPSAIKYARSHLHDEIALAVDFD